jgi:hypothetical protein
MMMTRTILAGLMVLMLVLGPACDVPPAEYVYGVDLTGLTFNLHTANMGVYPDTSVLEDPHNLFAHSAIAPDTKWDINNFAGPVAAFYCWATMLTREPTGEHQYYTATALADIWDTALAPDAALPFVRQMAIDAFQSVLDSFPGSVSYDITGTWSFRLAPLAYEGIVEMGGSVKGWVLVQTPDGGTEVIPVDDDSVPEVE